METQTVREQVLDHAQTLIKQRGYNGFSYRDLAKLVGVKTSSIHYYFPGKEDLVLEAVNTYSSAVLAEMYAIDSSLSADKQLERYARSFGKLLVEGNTICLCGMLAAEIGALPEHIALAVRGFFNANEVWLAKVLAQGAQEGSLRFNGSPERAARALYAAFQGSLLASRLFQGKDRLNEVALSLKIQP
ncbi:TetR/AcrR family transcriptional regulator [Burkholderia sp. L27(2015)]|uniref:TetR/AcrR family transcriptional regulator n=1 Tax=Burkholderia sp. L27(2015) TaxID=1641858 RepID=UPI00131B9FAF|nr:TetR/AcrR family transcriptional regulator [Burkholderia sp. L27(2015)]